MFGEPASLLVLLALALLLTQPFVAPNRLSSVLNNGLRAGLKGGLPGLVCGALVAASGLIVDPTLLLYTLAVATGALVAWGRPWPALLRAFIVAIGAGAVVLMLMPASSPDLAFRLLWLGGVLLAVVSLFGCLLGLLRALLGRKPGPVRLMLLRVLGSWSAAAALLAGVLELSRRLA